MMGRGPYRCPEALGRGIRDTSRSHEDTPKVALGGQRWNSEYYNLRARSLKPGPYWNRLADDWLHWVTHAISVGSAVGGVKSLGCGDAPLVKIVKEGNTFGLFENFYGYWNTCRDQQQGMRQKQP